MKNLYDDMPNGYLESIQKGLAAVRGFSEHMSFGTGTGEERIAKLKREIETADAIVIGSGAGLSTSAGFTYSGERFERYFFDFARQFGIRDIYSGGFYPFPDEETRWTWGARHIYYNRFIDPPKPVYRDLLALVKDRDYFSVTTNVDHQFQRADFDKSASSIHRETMDFSRLWTGETAGPIIILTSKSQPQPAFIQITHSTLPQKYLNRPLNLPTSKWPTQHSGQGS